MTGEVAALAEAADIKSGRHGSSNAMKPPKLTTDNQTQAAWWKRPGLIYFFGVGRPLKAIKIGVTSVGDGKSVETAVRQRFKSIQSANHETVELLGILRFVDGEYPVRLAEVAERELHIRFAALQRFARHTVAAEWFNPAPDLLAYIDEVAEKPESIGLPRLIAVAANRADTDPG